MSTKRGNAERTRWALPEEQTTEEFLNRLTPSCYKQVVEAAMALTFGVNWREELKGD